MVRHPQLWQRSGFGLIERFTFVQINSVIPEQLVSALLVLVAHYYSLSKAAVHCSLPTPPEGPLLGTPIAQSLMLRARTFNLAYTLFLLVQLTLWIF
jgi:hypothetical protein